MRDDDGPPAGPPDAGGPEVPLDPPDGPPQRCRDVRLSLSAAADGEDAPVGPVERGEHLGTCAACRDWAARAERVDRRVRVAPALPVRDRTDEVVAAVLADGRRRDRRPSPVRAGLALAAAAHLVVVVPALVVADAGPDVPPHAARELGVFNLALGVAFAVAAYRPSRAPGLRLPTGVAAVALCLLAVVDAALGRTTVAVELPHLASLAGWVLLCVLVRRGGGDGPGPGRVDVAAAVPAGRPPPGPTARDDRDAA
ncbi:hypothetical protein [Pseudonocardia spirodelae]|uniref:Zinc-finger domain-containing protein n=1 Tax=Pseudonocardia spirodelae TaxID=3133431 RepID=A0ABU8TEQ2_9PSEU